MSSADSRELGWRYAHPQHRIDEKNFEANNGADGALSWPSVAAGSFCLRLNVAKLPKMLQNETM